MRFLTGTGSLANRRNTKEVAFLGPTTIFSEPMWALTLYFASCKHVNSSHHMTVSWLNPQLTVGKLPESFRDEGHAQQAGAQVGVQVL